MSAASYDPVLALSQRRRDRHTLLSVDRSTDANINEQIATLLKTLAVLREAQTRDFAGLETRISDLEALFGQIAKIPRKEVA